MGEHGDAAPAPTRGRRTAPQRLVLVCNVLVVLGLLGAAGGLAYGYEKYGQIPRVALGDFLASADDDVAEGAAENFLVVGVDSAAGLDPDDPLVAQRSAIGGLRSDTMMVLRVDPAAARASLLSLPRDLFVPIPGAGTRKLNAAVQIGGPELLVETVQDYLGIPVNHYVQVDFAGFFRLVEAIDGVPVAFPHPVRDVRSGLAVPEAGCVVLDPANALGFVRSRAYQEFVDGRWRTDGTGDLGRITRQQLFIVAALDRAFDRGLRNPVTLDRLVDAGIGAVTVDDTLDGDDLLSLASQFRRFDPASLDVRELPVEFGSSGGASILRLLTREAEPVLDAFRDVDPTVLTESEVRVRVLNGTGEPGQAAEAATALRRAGFASGGTGDARRLGVVVTEVRHPPGAEVEADLVRRWAAGTTRLVEDDEVDQVTLVTGRTWEGLRDAPRPPAATTTTAPTTTTSTTTTRPEATTTSVVGTIPVGDDAGGC